MRPNIIASFFFLSVVTANAIDIFAVLEDILEPPSRITADCFWSGTSPFCAGSCPDNYVDCRTNGCGDGACCWTGYKKYCCRGKECPAQLTQGHHFELPSSKHANEKQVAAATIGKPRT
ncbi:hypothetical protein F5B20DRAFT_285241 [Whalleya microplaca]|nr:hypothetical protein F5B20DRAFT_285241 [Whalleya microplaca]